MVMIVGTRVLGRFFLTGPGTIDFAKVEWTSATFFTEQETLGFSAVDDLDF